jgi:hypothetical protein
MSAIRKRIELNYVPRPYQREAHRNRKRFSVFVWHRRAGKTVYSLTEANLEALRKQNGRFAYIAPFRNQAKSVAWDILKKLVEPLEKFVTISESELSITYPNGATIRLFGADNPDALRGLAFDGVVLDEVAQMRPELWSEVVRPALADRKGWAIFIGTPKGVNIFSELYQHAQRDPLWYSEIRRVSETGALPPEEIELMRAEFQGRESAWAQEMECDFSAGVENALLSLEDVIKAQRTTVAQADFMYAPKILGVDVARYGDDRSCIVMRQGPLCNAPKVFAGVDLMTMAGHVAQTIDLHKPDAVFIDQGGVGGGVIDRLRQLGHTIVGVDFGGKALDTRFDNRRAEMWWNLAEWVKNAGASLPNDTAFVTDLTAPTYTYANARGKMALESKDAMKARGLRSPDIGDALALTFAAPVAIRTVQDNLSQQYGNRGTTSDYDPFSSREVH